jgi:hypothetical protein
MNCWEWRKKITASVSAEGSYDFSYTSPDGPSQSYTLNGSQTFSHATPYTAWTHRELRCVGGPLPTTENPKTDWVLRGTQITDPSNVDVCTNRTTLLGNLSQQQAMTVSSSKPDLYPDQFWWLYFWTTDFNGLWTASRNLLQGNWIYPDLENDPYSVAGRAIIDGFISAGQIYIYADFFADDPAPQDFPPTNAIPLTWYKGGVSGEKNTSGPNTTENKSLSLSITFALA